jgi:Icc-related predicted phosphoesterase
MRVLSLQPEPIAEVRYLDAGRSAGDIATKQLPILAGTVDRLPEGVCALLATADLQGRETFAEAGGRPLRLVGETLPARLATEILPELGWPEAAQVGVLLAGDFFTAPLLDHRGGTGDVTDVWRAFARSFAWVTGVAGNHDTFGEEPDARLRNGAGQHYLDGDRVQLGGFWFAGLGGLIGNPRRPHRREEEEFLTTLELLVEGPTDVLLMHDGPDAPEQGYRGIARARNVIERHAPGVVVRGHAHWDEPLVELAAGVQVLNVHEKVVLLRQAEAGTTNRSE